jgi:hypothetical protein
MNTLDDAIKTFLVWKGLAHLAFTGYVAIAFYLVVSAWHAPTLSPEKAALVGSMVSVGLPMMLNWYLNVMAATQREPKS